ncbi:ankyrin [Sporormia fimetaria CBS 119925]|uniref:Ankyrin n=1 Tax=Sporormia fimetaria CBS 119925 TaxID=1340428 RepID=A0A6A6UVB1_9PLEO|nr:ankyrin [Sporormia fimetaria CBS 119925]
MEGKALPPVPSSYPLRSATPVEVSECYQAACEGDIDRVKSLAQLFLSESSKANAEPNPKWLYGSLSIAIQNQNLDIVQFLLDIGVVDGDLLAEDAVRARAFKVLELFVDRGWDINKPMGRGRPPMLSIPLCNADMEMVVWFLNHGANPNCRCDWDLTPMSEAMYDAPLDLIKYLFSRGADARYGQLLHHAIHRKEDTLQVVQWLVENGAPIDELKYETDPIGYWWREPFGLGTPLHRAAELGKKDIVTYLLCHGANCLKEDSRGKTPRFWAEKEGHTDVALILKEAEDRSSALNTGVFAGKSRSLI